MSTTLPLQQQRSDPVPIPKPTSNDNEEQAYRDMIKQLAAQAPEPYGAIPPLVKRNKDKSKKKKKKKKKMLIRRMSHVENWLAVDSKESIPDDDDLVHSSPFRNFLSTDFLVLPLHMPPPSLSATVIQEVPEINPKKPLSSSSSSLADLRPVLYPIKQPPIQVIPITDSRNLPPPSKEEEDEEEDEDEEEEEEEEDSLLDDDDEEEEEESKTLAHKRSIPSFSKSHEPSTSTTKSYAMSTSPPSSGSAPTNMEEPKSRWMETIAQLRRSLTRSTRITFTDKRSFIPMPLPPKRTGMRKRRRSEATTQPRFNPETNTYTRDTRSNPDHLRMISAELNMMRHKKLSSPLKPRGFLPRRTDAFIRGEQRKQSALCYELL